MCRFYLRDVSKINLSRKNYYFGTVVCTTRVEMMVKWHIHPTKLIRGSEKMWHQGIFFGRNKCIIMKLGWSMGLYYIIMVFLWSYIYKVAKKSCKQLFKGNKWDCIALVMCWYLLKILQSRKNILFSDIKKSRWLRYA